MPPSSTAPRVPADTGQWFREEVQPHEPSLRGYLRGAFPSVRDVDDVVQESFLRIWRARLAQPIASTKSFLFQIARRLAIDTLRERASKGTDDLGDTASLSVLVDAHDAAEQLCYHDKVELLAAAFVNLPPRCREIMTLRKLQGHSLRDIAQRLGISEHTVENQITRGIKLCRDYLNSRGVEDFDRR